MCFEGVFCQNIYTHIVARRFGGKGTADQILVPEEEQALL